MNPTHRRNAPGSFRILLALVMPFLAGGAGSAEEIRPDPVLEIERFEGAEIVKGEILVRFAEGVAVASRAAVHAEMGCEVVTEAGPRTDRVRLGADLSLKETLHRYENAAAVETVEPHYVYRLSYTPNDPNLALQWGFKKLGCTAAWDAHIGSSSAIVVMIDSGVDRDHPDLVGNYAWGYDFYALDGDPEDQYGHGTHTTGTAAAVTNNGQGVSGMGWLCRYAAYRAGDYYLTNAAVISSIYDATARGAHVLSMSFGSETPSTLMEIAINHAHSVGLVAVASAGNDDSTTPNYPAAFTNVIAVASSTNLDTRSSFSNYGAWVDVAAPGSGILSTTFNGGYGYMDGTSMACPHVSGMAVLIYDLLGVQRSQAKAQLVRDTIQNTAKDVGSWVIHGRVDLAAAMAELTAQPPVLSGVSPSSVQALAGGTMTLTGTNLGFVTQVTVGATVLEAGDFTVKSDTMITFPAPTAPALGSTAVTVTNTAGTSNPVHFDYVETDPPKLLVPAFAGSSDTLNWTFGGKKGNFFFLVVSASSQTFPYQGFSLLVDFSTLDTGPLDAVGLGGFSIVLPSGFQGVQFYSQVFTGQKRFEGASTVRPTLILN